MFKRILTLTILTAFSLGLSGCWWHGHHHLPPGQIKKQTAPGQLKKHTWLFPDKITIKID